ncbi:15202_t:CDS:2, partial [Racocetra fulgida]
YNKIPEYQLGALLWTEMPVKGMIYDHADQPNTNKKKKERSTNHNDRIDQSNVVEHA